MSELQLQPIPGKPEYATVVEQCDAEFKRLGGILPLIQDYEIIAAEGSRESLYDEINQMAQIAFGLEPKRGNGTAQDEKLGITYAFRRGLTVGSRTTQVLYEGRIKSSEVRSSLRKGVPESEFQQEGAVIDDTPLLEWGRTGLGLAGETAVGYVDGWANLIARDITHQGIFKLGWGAFIATAHAIAINRNLNRVTEYFATDEWEVDLRELLASTTGE